MSILSPQELNDLRQAVLDGKEFSAEEYKRIIQSYRSARLQGVTVSAEKTKAKAETKAKAAPVDLGALMASLIPPKKEEGK